jgi:capsular exopolysaccharide synthesis family protein
MSRNFELLKNIGKEQEVFEAPELFVANQEPETVMEAPVLQEPTIPLNIGVKELEEVSKAVQRLFLVPGSASPRSVVFTGTEPGNGCSWMCARAAEVLAGQVSGTVCVVDANLRAPALHEMFGVPNRQGLSDSLRSVERIRGFVGQLSRPNLYLVSCGSPTDNWQALVSSERMRLRLAELSSEFDYVLIDSAAMSVSSDAVVLGGSADGVVLVLKANSSRRESARKAVHELQTARARVLGAVLNQRTFPIPEAIYKKL